jgi:murein DD-endopeptidase MepM/ murein hydrolase activator NlpD
VVRRLFVVVIVMGLIQFGATAPVPRPAGAAPVVATRWVRPVDGPVVRPFVAPVSVYGAGHRGADLSVPLATPVHAAGAGRVVFAGAVAGSLHVVVLHPGGLRTSYSYLSAVSVHEGDDVTAGAIVGLSGTDPDDAGPALHFALRVGDTYVDPMVLFRAPDLTRLVHLAPDDGPDLEPLLPPGSAREAAGLADGLGRAADTEAAAPGPGIGLPDVLPGVGTVLDVLGTVARAAATLPPAVGAPLRAFVVDAAQRLATAPLASAAVAIQLRSVVEDLGRWAASRLHCTLHPHAADGSGGDGNLVLVAAGITSERPGAAPPLDLPLDRLGFRPADVTYFSYRPGSVTYTEADSFRDLDAEAVNLGVQLRALAAAHPGRRVDLLAHSQGGLVVLAFLASVYDPGDPAYPPLGAVVTFASPLSGAPAAGRVVLDVLRDRFDVPPADGTSTGQLAPGSGFLRGLRARGLPAGVRFTSIAGVDDPVAPAPSTRFPGTIPVLVDPGGGIATEHTAIVRDDDALAAARGALLGDDPPCEDWRLALRGTLEPRVITGIEKGLGGAGPLGGAARALG